MHIRRLNRLLWAAAVAISATGALVVAAAILQPAQMTAPTSGHRNVRATDAQPDSTPPLQSFASLWDMRLRRPLVDPKPVPPPPPPPPPVFSVKVEGINQVDNELSATLHLADNTDMYDVKVGQVVNVAQSFTAKVVKIEADKVTFEYVGQLVVVSAQ